MSSHNLTDKQAQAFLAQAPIGAKLADGEGLYLYKRNHGCCWRIRYRLSGKERLYTIGDYPAYSLKSAREELFSVKKLVAEGIDPVLNRKLRVVENQNNLANSLNEVADAWFGKQQHEWSDIHYKKSRRAYERDIAPTLGHLPVAKITSPLIFEALKTVWSRGAKETAHRILQHLQGIFQYAVASGFCANNPATAVTELLPSKRPQGHMHAVLSTIELQEIFRRAELAHLETETRLAHKLCAFTAMRISNVVEARWEEFDLEADVPVWSIPREKMKTKSKLVNHRIPIHEPLLTELRNWKKVCRANKGYVFPSDNQVGHLTREAVEKAYRVTLKLKGLHTPHGWRAALATLARDHGFDRDVVSLALDHVHDNKTEVAYDRGERFKQRVELFRWWASLLTSTGEDL